jgi:hypothetical protein
VEAEVLARLFVLATAMVALAPAAHAQFTGVVVPPKQETPVVTDSAAAVVAAQADRPTQLSDMRAWVDSAAASLGVQAASADSSAPVAAAPIEAQAPVEVNEGSMATGMRAPDTATLLPMLLLVGAVFMSAGTFLVCTRRPRGHGTESGTGTSERHA